MSLGYVTSNQMLISPDQQLLQHGVTWHCFSPVLPFNFLILSMKLNTVLTVSLNEFWFALHQCIIPMNLKPVSFRFNISNTPQLCRHSDVLQSHLLFFCYVNSLRLQHVALGYPPDSSAPMCTLLCTCEMPVVFENYLILLLKLMVFVYI